MAQAAQAEGVQVQALASEPPRGPNPLPVPCRLHAFDHVDSVVSQMRGFDAVLDASHGFDDTLSRMGFAAAVQLGLPFLSYRRPLWSRAGNDSWQRAANARDAMGLVGAGARVFSAAGWASMPDCAEFPGARLFLRQTQPHDRDAPYDFVQLVFGDPPFTPDSEAELFKALQIDTLVARNLGGQASRPKLDAAIALGLQVILIDPPALPEGVKVVQDVDAALAWVAAQ